jgi:hypothetical protein
LSWLAGGVFVATFLSRAVWLPDAPFHPDESTVLWMALNAVRHLQLPDHGLVSSYHAFQPPGLVWATMPFVGLGGGRPEFVIVGFALLNAAAITFLVTTVARSWGLVNAAVLAAFLAVGPDAFFSAWVWHPSLYTGAIALLIAAGIRLRTGSAWWALVLAALPGLYALVHYSGFVLFGPAVALLLLSRRRPSALMVPLVAGAALAAAAWAPFLSFEAHRGWVDFNTISRASDQAQTLGGKLDARYVAGRFALSHLGQSLHDPVLLTPVILAMAFAALLTALLRKRITDPGFALPAAVLVSGLAAQVVTNEGDRTDVLMLWLVPLYVLAGWAAGQAREVARVVLAGRVPATAVTAAAAAVVVVPVLALGSVDLSRAVGSTPASHTLSQQWRAARADAPVSYDAGIHPSLSANTLYLPCDPPYDWGSETWYLEDVLHPGTGLRAAVKAGAFRWRNGPPCKTLPPGKE